jgi:uncharacterized protein with FMN-binding domain
MRRRAIPVLMSTAAGLALLASFHTNSGPSATVNAASATAATAPSTSTSTTTKRSVATAPPTTAAVTRTVDGSVIDTRYGPVQVRVTLQGTRIVNVLALQLPFDHPRSNQISQQAAPLLRSEVLQAQSARIQLLSGASYTSEGYAESVQAALDRAGV